MLLASLFLTVAAEAPQIDTGTPLPPTDYKVDVVADGLDHPWSMAWLPSGDMLVTERAGRLRVIRDGKLLDAPVEGLPAIHVRSQSGLFEVMLHPDFAENNWVYFSYASGTRRDNTLALARGRFVATAQGGRLDEVEEIFRAAPARDTSAHYGGRMVWLEDGTLLLTSGEGYKYKDKAQTLDNHFGKVLRLNADGSVPADNPFVGRDDALAEIWSYGHRNGQGIVLTPDGTVYSNEHGPRGGDELNEITPGTNYGWPVITYGIDYSGAQISPFKEMKGMAQPLFHWTPSIAPSSLHYYEGGDFPAWDGKLLSGSLSFNHVRIADPRTPAAAQQELLRDRGQRVRDVGQSPSGTLFVATERRNDPTGGEILAILPEQ